MAMLTTRGSDLLLHFHSIFALDVYVLPLPVQSSGVFLCTNKVKKYMLHLPIKKEYAACVHSATRHCMHKPYEKELYVLCTRCYDLCLVRTSR